MAIEAAWYTTTTNNSSRNKSQNIGVSLQHRPVDLYAFGMWEGEPGLIEARNYWPTAWPPAGIWDPTETFICVLFWTWKPSPVMWLSLSSLGSLTTARPLSVHPIAMTPSNWNGSRGQRDPWDPWVSWSTIGPAPKEEQVAPLTKHHPYSALHLKFRSFVKQWQGTAC